MLYPYMTLDDMTEIVHSEVLPDGRVKVIMETPDELDFFHNAVCYLPEMRWEKIFGYTEEELCFFHRLIKSNRDSIMRYAAQGGRNSTAQEQEKIWSISELAAKLARKEAVSYEI